MSVGPDHEMLDPRREVRALCAATSVALDAVERAGLLVDDTPEYALSTLERWAVGEADALELAEVIDQTQTLVRAHQEQGSKAPPPLVAVVAAVDCVARVARDVEWAGVDAEVTLDRTALWWAETVLELLGEESEAAAARIALSWDQALHAPAH